MDFIKAFSTALVCSFALDMLWLGVIAKKLYDDNIGFLLRKSNGNLAPYWPSAIMVYLAIALGVVIFVTPKANGNLIAALLWGAAFGAVTYGIYDFTNHAILANWPLKISIIDIIWGATLCGTVSLVTTYVTRSLYS